MSGAKGGVDPQEDQPMELDRRWFQALLVGLGITLTAAGAGSLTGVTTPGCSCFRQGIG